MMKLLQLRVDVRCSDTSNMKVDEVDGAEAPPVAANRKGCVWRMFNEQTPASGSTLHLAQTAFMTAACAISPKVVKTSSFTLSSPENMLSKKSPVPMLAGSQLA